ncbi:basic proline-rich protein-like [Camarhynchus parvulus]|uniref:basic proline-rich protein-like n=1 Tax=Geospiza parvula TaxID=87175 RepID=UPI001237C583|nr:basic proline-rich protein-like [Camarhynchus parvulus]
MTLAKTFRTPSSRSSPISPRGAQHWAQHSRCASPRPPEGRIPSLALPATLLRGFSREPPLPFPARPVPGAGSGAGIGREAGAAEEEGPEGDVTARPPARGFRDLPRRLRRPPPVPQPRATRGPSPRSARPAPLPPPPGDAAGAVPPGCPGPAAGQEPASRSSTASQPRARLRLRQRARGAGPAAPALLRRRHGPAAPPGPEVAALEGAEAR